MHHAGLMRHPHGPDFGTQNISPADVKEPAASLRDPQSSAPGTSGDAAAAAPASSSRGDRHQRLVTVLVGEMCDCFSGVMALAASICLLPPHSRTQRPGARLTCAAVCTTLSDEQQNLISATLRAGAIVGGLAAAIVAVVTVFVCLHVCTRFPGDQTSLSALIEIAAALPPARPLVLFGGHSASAHTLRSLARHFRAHNIAHVRLARRREE